MPRLFFGNFDFEHQLTGSALPQTGSQLDRINLELTPALISLTQGDDCVWFPAECDETFLDLLTTNGLPRPHLLQTGADLPSQMKLVPWGWSPQIAGWAKQHGCLSEHPQLKRVKQANCRLFAHQMESEWNCGLPGTVELHDLSQVAAVIKNHRQHASRWVIKALYGMSGRERQLGSSGELNEQTAQWVQKRLKRDGAVIFEPWVERIDEAGLQFDIPREGEPQLLGVTPLFSDAAGQYRGNRITISAADTAVWQPAVEITQRLARHLQASGYFGPLGIDAMRYRDAQGRERIRPLQDINARLTMGRLGLGFRRCLAEGEVGTWLNLPLNLAHESLGDFLDQKQQQLPAGCRLLPTSPATINGQIPHLMQILLTALTEQDLAEAENAFLL